MDKVGLIFTNRDLNEVRDEMEKHKVPAPALVGMVSPVDVNIPRGITNLFSNGGYSIFQELKIPIKIKGGWIEILTDVKIINKGDRVGSSEAVVLARLDIKPFSHGLIFKGVYDNGSEFSPEVLDMTEEDLIDKFVTGLSMVTSLAMAVSYPTLSAVPHMISNGFKNLMAVGMATGYTFPQADQAIQYLKYRIKFVSVPAPVVAKVEYSEEVIYESISEDTYV